jgi:putative methionine-R-sulfoxide reductase with GAF domain
MTLKTDGKTKSTYELNISSEANSRLMSWLETGKEIAPLICDWIGIYFKESYLLNNDSTDLVLGPYIGEATEHVRIPVNRGICGLAIREARTVNVPDVRQNSEHIACSLKTRSELVIPLKDEAGEIIAELDIDSNRLGAFTPDLEASFQKYADTFAAQAFTPEVRPRSASRP